MVPRTHPLSQSRCTCHPCAVLVVNTPKLSLLWTTTCCLREPTLPSANRRRGSTGQSPGSGTLQWLSIPEGPPPVLDQATSLLMACSFLSCTFLVYSESIPLSLEGKTTRPIKLRNLSFIGKQCICL